MNKNILAHFSNNYYYYFYYFVIIINTSTKTSMVDYCTPIEKESSEQSSYAE